MENAERRVVITGSRRGIGRQLCEYYLSQGQTVCGISRQPSELTHARYSHFMADVADEAAICKVIAEISAQGSIDLLINNAGFKSNSYGILTTAEQAHKTIQTNLLGSFLVTRQVLKTMRRRRTGRIVSLTSVAVPLSSRGTALYGASKAALEQLTSVLAREVAADDITLNAVGISLFADSEMVSAIAQSERDELGKALPKPKPLSIQEIAHAIDFFASPLASNVTGQVVYFGGVE